MQHEMFDSNMDNPNSTLVPAGIDEVGRGPVFGCMVVAGVANPWGYENKDVKDSKKYNSTNKLERVAREIMAHTLWVIHEIPVGTINSVGVNRCMAPALRSITHGLIRECHRIQVRLPHLKLMLDGDDFADGDTIVKVDRIMDARVTYRSEPKADATYFECSAASVIAKAYRDRRMVAICQEHPELLKYQIDRNKGYGSDAHASALIKYGQTPWHRRQFATSLMRTYRKRMQADPNATPQRRVGMEIFS